MRTFSMIGGRWTSTTPYPNDDLFTVSPKSQNDMKPQGPKGGRDQKTVEQEPFTLTVLNLTLALPATVQATYRFPHGARPDPGFATLLDPCLYSYIHHPKEGPSMRSFTFLFTMLCSGIAENISSIRFLSSSVTSLTVTSANSYSLISIKGDARK